jgi:hypothetical protein
VTDTLPTTVARSGPRSSTFDAAVLTHLRRHIREFEQRRSDLSTSQNVNLHVTSTVSANEEALLMS